MSLWNAPLLSVSVPLHHFAFVFLFNGTFTPDSFHFLCALVSALPSILFYKLYSQKCSCSLFKDAFLLLPLVEQAILEPKFPATSFAIESRELATSICALRVGSFFSDVHISGCFCEIKQGLGRQSRHLVFTSLRNINLAMTLLKQGNSQLYLLMIIVWAFSWACLICCDIASIAWAVLVALPRRLILDILTLAGHAYMDPQVSVSFLPTWRPCVRVSLPVEISGKL